MKRLLPLLVLAVFCFAPMLVHAADPAQIAKSITIYRDNYGVPHIYGPTDAACAFGFMYAQAEDNFWQIEDSYIRSLGRASEVYGGKTLDDDELVRALEIPKLARAEFEHMPARTRAVLEAGTEGLNYFLATHPQVKPRLLTHFEPWYGLAFNRYALYFQFIYGRSGLRRDEIKSVTEPQSAKPGATRRDPKPVLAQNREPGRLAQNDGPASLLAENGDFKAKDEDFNTAAESQGSNMWAITPAKTVSGHAMLFINPHQPFFGTGQWYEGHVHSDEGWDMAGASFFGSALPTIGHNEFLGWSHTVNAPDIVDVWEETFDRPGDPLAYKYDGNYRRATEWTDTVKIKTDSGMTERKFTFRKTHHGSIVARR
jgi:acyl-homoserine-lactone acylase